MFFITSTGAVFHKLNDKEEGHAPLPCGARLDRYSLWQLGQGKQSPRVFEQIPAGGRLCKVCEEAQSSDC